MRIYVAAAFFNPEQSRLRVGHISQGVSKREARQMLVAMM